MAARRQVTLVTEIELSGVGVFWAFCLALWSLLFGGVMTFHAVQALATGVSSGVAPLLAIGLTWIGGAIVFAAAMLTGAKFYTTRD